MEPVEAEEKEGFEGVILTKEGVGKGRGVEQGGEGEVGLECGAEGVEAACLPDLAEEGFGGVGGGGAELFPGGPGEDLSIREEAVSEEKGGDVLAERRGGGGGGAEEREEGRVGGRSDGGGDIEEVGEDGEEVAGDVGFGFLPGGEKERVKDAEGKGRVGRTSEVLHHVVEALGAKFGVGVEGGEEVEEEGLSVGFFAEVEIHEGEAEGAFDLEMGGGFGFATVFFLFPEFFGVLVAAEVVEEEAMPEGVFVRRGREGLEEGFGSGPALFAAVQGEEAGEEERVGGEEANEGFEGLALEVGASEGVVDGEEKGEERGVVGGLLEFGFKFAEACGEEAEEVVEGDEAFEELAVVVGGELGMLAGFDPGLEEEALELGFVAERGEKLGGTKEEIGAVEGRIRTKAREVRMGRGSGLEEEGVEAFGVGGVSFA